MAGASADGEVNHWPAFVDVLTTVIMVVTFMLVIMSAAVMMLSQRAIKRAEQQYMARQAADPAAKAKRPAAPGGVSQLGDVVKAAAPIAGSEPVSILTRETKDTLAIRVKSVEAAENTKGVEVSTSDTLLKVAFEPDAMRYDEDNQSRVLAFLKGKAAPGVTYEVWSFVPQTGSISEAQRLAFYRAAVTRNLLIRAGIAPGTILTQIRITDPRAPDGHMVRVVVKP
ncbi:MAG: hypothetical protein KGN34_00115 [Sphingomonadales bacterium]|nr:hypothetical protein [Sphingomonadales bacterium]